MMRYAALIVFCAFAFAALAGHQANAANAPGESCTEIGKTIMTDDHMNILACLCETTDNCSGTSDLKWKIMTVNVLTNGTFTCPDKQAIVKIVNGVPKCATY
jgi:hypothetical protein